MRNGLIHCITNPISMNQCANAVLALGGRPIMAEHSLEVEEITATSAALLLNLGNISERRMEAMLRAFRVANECQIPVVIDAVGIACSELRRIFVQGLVESNQAAVIKGNYSEMLALADPTYKSSGVDAGTVPDLTEMKAVVSGLATKHQAVIVATGAVDLVATPGYEADKVTEIRGGSPMLSQVTGTGCMLGAVIATALAAFGTSTGKTVEKACQVFKDCGRRAADAAGDGHGGTFMVKLLDELGEYDGF